MKYFKTHNNTSDIEVVYLVVNDWAEKSARFYDGMNYIKKSNKHWVWKWADGGHMDVIS